MREVLYLGSGLDGGNQGSKGLKERGRVDKGSSGVL